jgi:hypothetical protein
MISSALGTPNTSVATPSAYVGTVRFQLMQSCWYALMLIFGKGCEVEGGTVVITSVYVGTVRFQLRQYRQEGSDADVC